MPDVTLSWAGVESSPVLAGELNLPLVGAWTAQLELDAPSPPAGSVTLRWLGTELRGAVLRAGASAGRVAVQIVGGSGGLSKRARAQEYTNDLVGNIVSHILGDGGEVLSASSTAAVLKRSVARWVRTAQPVSAQLDSLTLWLGAGWRVLPDGAVWVGTDEWPEPGKWEYSITSFSPETGEFVLVPERLGLLPGHLFEGVRIDSVVYLVTSRGVYARAFGHREEESPPPDPQRAALWQLVSEHPSVSRFDWLATYPAVVVKDNGDGTVDLRPESELLPTLTRVPVRACAPGARVSVASGKRCTLGWLLGAHGTLPFVDSWESGGSVKAVARVDDLADAGTLAFTVVPPVPPSPVGQLTITYTPPPGAGGPTVIGPIAITGLAGPSGVIQLKAKITEGSPHLALPSGKVL